VYDGYPGSLPGIKRSGRGVDDPPHLTLRLKNVHSRACMTCYGETFTYAIRIKRSILHSPGYCGIRADSYNNVGLYILDLSICKNIFRSPQRQEITSPPKHLDRLWGPSSHLLNKGKGSFPRGEAAGM